MTAIEYFLMCLSSTHEFNLHNNLTLSSKELKQNISLMMDFNSANETSYSLLDEHETTKNIIRIIQRVVIPVICMFGLIGNILCLIIFTRRLLFGSINAVERGALLGLAALAGSDLAFCLITCLGSIMRTHRIMFVHFDLEYYYQAYSVFLLNVFIKTSTWLTMIAAISRYAVVCYPLWARQFIRLSYLKSCMLASFIFAVVIHLPLIWTYNITQLTCKNETMRIFDTGLFFKIVPLNKSFTYIWAISGFIIPLIVLTFCNVRLILSFRNSMKVRSQLRRHHGADASNSHHFTVILIVVVILFIILVTPSEIMHFYEIIARPQSIAFSVAMELCNVLQAVNFSINFLLYSLINAYIRQIFNSLIKHCGCHRFSCSPEDLPDGSVSSSFKSRQSQSTCQSEIQLTIN